MRALSAVIMTAFLVLMIGGCAGQKEPMDSEMSSMDKPMDKSMNEETMMKDAAMDPMKPKMDSMDKSVKEETMMENEATDPMKPKMVDMEKATQ